MANESQPDLSLFPTVNTSGPSFAFFELVCNRRTNHVNAFIFSGPYQPIDPKNPSATDSDDGAEEIPSSHQAPKKLLGDFLCCFWYRLDVRSDRSRGNALTRNIHDLAAKKNMWVWYAYARDAGWDEESDVWAGMSRRLARCRST